MSHTGKEKDWRGLLEFYISSSDYVPTLKRITISQWIQSSRRTADSEPGTSELATEAVNFAALRFNRRMEIFGAGKYEYKGETFCKFDDVEHFIDGYFYFIGSGGYDKWHQLAHRPLDFIAHLEEKGFAGNDDQYAEKIQTIYEHLEDRYAIDLPEIKGVRHTVSHGEYTYKIAENYNVNPNKVFRLDRNGSIHYGNDIGVLHTGDFLFVLTDRELAAETVSDPLADLSPCQRVDGGCAGRTHFVIHQTVAGNLTRTSVISRYGGRRNKAHVYVLKSGETVFLWNFTEKLITATKAELPGSYSPIRGQFPDFPIRGKLIHVEVDYEEDGRPNEAQYRTLAQLYIDACRVVERLLIIVPHIEIDRGIRNGHNDPQNFDYDHFYDILTERGIDISRIPKFSHDRYWGRNTYKIPWDTDTFHFPPVLEGNPHS